jgi:hypothetical protein
MRHSHATPSAALCFGLVFLLALLPGLSFGIPAAMVDYPNHLARMFVLARDGTAAAHPYYQAHWAVIPDRAMDLLVPPAGRLIGVETATRLFYLLSQILIVTGAMAIARAVKGSIYVAGFSALMFLYSFPFALGFVNFEFGLGCALWGIACALRVMDRSWPIRLALHAVFIAGLFAAHLFALGIYGFTVGVHELWRARSRRLSLQEAIARLAVLGLPALVPAAALIASGGTVGGHGTQWYYGLKPLWIVLIMNGYSLIASAIGLALLLGLVLALRQRKALRFEQSGVWLAAGFAALYFAMPARLFDTSFVDLRVLIAAALILPAFVSVRFPSPAWAKSALMVAAAVTLLNTGVALGVWLSYRTDYAAALDSFARLPKGARVLIGHSGAGDDPPLANLAEYPVYELPVLAVHYADAFVPNFFTAPGKQPISVRPDLQRLDIPHAGPAPVKLLQRIAAHRAPAGTPAFLRDWPRDFEFLYLVGPRTPNPMPDLLEEVSAAPRFVLYRIRKSAHR